MLIIRYLKAASCLTLNSQSLKYIKVGASLMFGKELPILGP